MKGVRPGGPHGAELSLRVPKAAQVCSDPGLLESPHIDTVIKYYILTLFIRREL